MKFFNIWNANDDFNFALPFRDAGFLLNSRVSAAITPAKTEII